MSVSIADATRQCFLHPAGAPTAAVVSAVFGVVAALHRDVAAAPAWRASAHPALRSKETKAKRRKRKRE